MLRDRVVTAVVLVGALLGALFALPAIGWTALASLLLALAAWEWAGFVHAGNARRLAYAVLTTAVGVGAASAADLATGGAGTPVLVPLYALAVAFWIAAVPFWLGRARASAPAALILACGWIVLLPTYLALVQLRNLQPVSLLLFMLVVWIADIAAYFVGRRFGRRRLAPSVSPGKTWEGLAGALAATAVYALVWIEVLRGYAPAIIQQLALAPVWMLLLVQALAVLSVLGDLFESAMKRQAGVKDSGKLLPGHGGVLDRIDALTPVLPAAALASMARMM